MGRPGPRVNRAGRGGASGAVLALLVFTPTDAPCPPEAAQASTLPGQVVGVARQEPAGRSVWDGVYTSDQASRSRSGYRDECTICHLEDLLGDGVSPALVGESFRVQWDGQSVGDLYATIRATMPQGAPFILSPREYVDIVAFILSRNEYPSGGVELSPDRATLDEIVIEADRPG